MTTEVTHNYSRYSNGYCKCEICRRANTVYKSARAKAERAELKRLRAKEHKRTTK
jgi:hypothetical protein